MSGLHIVNHSPVYEGDTDPVPRLAPRGHPEQPWLSDKQGRNLKYLRLSVTDRCDLRCTYCMPAEGATASPREEVLSFEECTRLAKIFKELGVETIRITGGEPLTRREMVTLVRMLRDEAGYQDIALTTNATLLERFASPLRKAGLTRVNISLDSLEPEVFARLTRGGDLERVLRGVDAACDQGFEAVKTNTVVIRGENDSEIRSLTEWAWSKGITPRFIEIMPIGAAAELGPGAVVSIEEMKASLGGLVADEAPGRGIFGRGPASYLSSRGQGHVVGFIGAVTENFCEGCNRVRVTAKGEIRACLASPDGLALAPLLRGEDSDEAIRQRLAEALFGKREGHSFYMDADESHHRVAMSGIGG